MRPISLLVVLCLVSIPVSAANHADLFAAGKAALTAGDAEKSAKLLEEAVKLSPRNAEYRYYLGGAYGEAALSASLFGKASLAKKAKVELDKAVELDPNYIEPRFALIDFHLMAPGIMGGDPEKAVAHANEVKKRDNVEGHRAFARIYARTKKTDLARKEFVDAVRENPKSARAHYLLATFLWNERTGAARCRRSKRRSNSIRTTCPPTTASVHTPRSPARTRPAARKRCASIWRIRPAGTSPDPPTPGTSSDSFRKSRGTKRTRKRAS